ncbi:unnamed protein product [Spirodela intermedia]|uniref:Uncharacterized protein n=1 Tax=Spirodela intermedia TaxID=51605 RepID=A0A7I8KMG7_SPIIN|nr:unnamed protein product [Spirodela intermedia]
MDDLDAPLDFESEDALVSSVPVANERKRKKIIGLDDLLSEFYHAGNPVNESKKSSKAKHHDSDEEDNTSKNKEKLLSKFVSECQKQVNDILTEDDIPLWGRRAFGRQRSPPPLDSKALINCKLLQSFTKSKFSSILEMTIDKGEAFLEGLLVDGWLLNLVFLCGSVEDSLHSSKVDVQESGCDFWCSILPTEVEVNKPTVGLTWFPSFAQLKDALEIFGYSHGTLSPSASVDNASEICGPPVNIRCWLKLVATFCKMRNPCPIFSTSEVEELFDIIIWLFLDRQLQGLSFLLSECMLSIITFFTDEEWLMSSEKIATSIASRAPKDLNCFRIVECISGVDERTRGLRSQVSWQILTHSMGNPGANPVGILRSLSSVNVKDKNCDFFKVYIRLVLAENWLASGLPVEEGPAIAEVWSRYLRSLSTQISNTDWRSYAAKVRNRASYLLQSM